MALLSKVTDREKLKPRRDPYWSKISKGCFIGYRKMTADSSGNWSARCQDDVSGKQLWRPLGDFSNLPPNLQYDAAQKAAQAWFAHLGKGGDAGIVTVRDAADKYVSHLNENKGEKAAGDARARFETYVFNNKTLAATELSKLVPAHFEAWRKSLRDKPTTSGPNRGEKRTDSSLNRDMTCLRAALNLAYNDGLVTSDFAWRSKLRPVKNADQRRDVYLDGSQRRKLVAHAADDVANLLRGLSLVPLRTGALAALTVSSYDKRLKTLTIGKDKAGKDRKIMLPDLTAAFFSNLCRDKLPGAPLFVRSNGKAWDKDAWKFPVKEAVMAAELASNVTTYTIRHSIITDLIHSGLDTLTVAQLSGTSILMIEKHYGHLTREHAKEALARLSLLIKVQELDAS
jgi:integrase